MSNPYDNIPTENWSAKTLELIENHPLDTDEIVEIVQICWKAIFASSIGKFKIGYEIRPKPQLMGFLLHELIPRELQSRYPERWRPQEKKDDKDIVYIPDVSMSVEMKTSSSKSKIFGNRSYAQPQSDRGKSKDGYYLTINFERFKKMGKLPKVTLIRFGWLGHADWIAQTASTGQQARLRSESDAGKLTVLYRSMS